MKRNKFQKSKAIPLDQELAVTFAKRLMSVPAAPYHEQAVKEEVFAICTEHKLLIEEDRFGNCLVKSHNRSSKRPLVLAAHLDHPGFEIQGGGNGSKLLGQFFGGVPDDYFRKGIALRLLPGAAAATLGRRLSEDRKYEIRARAPMAVKPEFAVWELQDFALREGRIYGRACDDLIGAAAVLATLAHLRRHSVHGDIIGVLSRAEEVGFQGALMVAESKVLPENSLIISLETSREMPPVQMGKGVILRVGDRSSIFNSDAMRFLSEVASGLQNEDQSFKYQRALMSGGTCEATVYQEYGYQTAGVCVALGNYHNCGEENQIREEFVDQGDFLSMTNLLIEASLQMRHFDRFANKLPLRLKKLAKEGKRELNRRKS